MDVRIIAEGPADKDIIKAVACAVTKVQPECVVGILPSDLVDETDRYSGNFSNWTIVLEKIAEAEFLDSMMATVDEKFILVVHVDSAERGEAGYDVNEPKRSGRVIWNKYAEELRERIRQKLESLIPSGYRDHVAYAIAIEETEAWIIPMFENVRSETSYYAKPKEKLEQIVGAEKKLKKQYVNTAQKCLDYKKLGEELARDLAKCRKKNHSLDAFCVDLEKQFII